MDLAFPSERCDLAVYSEPEAGLALTADRAAIERAPSLGTFLEGPTGLYHVGGRFLLWALGPELVGVVFWGQPLSEDIDRYWSIVDDLVPSLGAEFDQVLDMRFVERIEDDVFTRMASSVRHRP